MARSLYPTRPQSQQIARFLVVGLLGTGIDIALFALLRGVFGLPVLLSNVLAYSAGIVNNYVLHRTWTYRTVVQKAVALQAVQFAAVSVCALAINTALVMVLAQPLGTLAGSTTVGDLLAKVCATAVGVGINFLANHVWTFRATPSDTIAH